MEKVSPIVAAFLNTAAPNHKDAYRVKPASHWEEFKAVFEDECEKRKLENEGGQNGTP